MATNRTERRREASLNRARGEVLLVVGEGDAEQSYKLVLTLAAMAEIEDNLGVESLQEVDKALSSGSSRALAGILAPMIRAGGAVDVTEAAVRKWPLTIGQITEALQKAFTAAQKNGDANPDPSGNA